MKAPFQTLNFYWPLLLVFFITAFAEMLVQFAIQRIHAPNQPLYLALIVLTLVTLYIWRFGRKTE